MNYIGVREGGLYLIPPSKADIEQWGVDLYAVTVHKKWLSSPALGGPDHHQPAIQGPWPARTEGIKEMIERAGRIPKGL